MTTIYRLTVKRGGFNVKDVKASPAGANAAAGDLTVSRVEGQRGQVTFTGTNKISVVRAAATSVNGPRRTV